MAMYKYISVIIPFGQLTSLGSQSSTGAAVPACEIIVINSKLSIDSFEKKMHGLQAQGRRAVEWIRQSSSYFIIFS